MVVKGSNIILQTLGQVGITRGITKGYISTHFGINKKDIFVNGKHLARSDINLYINVKNLYIL